MMENLRIVENELVPVYMTSTGEKVVYGTELHRVLQVKSNYGDWIKRRFNDCDAIENEDYGIYLKNEINSKRGRPGTEYIIKLDTAKEMAMLERNQKGKGVRRYFIQVEKKYKEQAKQPARPMTAVEQLYLQSTAILELDGKINAVDRDLQEFKQDMPIFGIETCVITEAAHDACVAALGGTGSRAYNDRSLRGKVYHDIYGRIKLVFGVESYKELKRNQHDMAVRMIRSYKAPAHITEQVKRYNTQIELHM